MSFGSVNNYFLPLGRTLRYTEPAKIDRTDLLAAETPALPYLKTKKRKLNDTFAENQNAKADLKRVFVQSMCFAAPGVSLANCLSFESISTQTAAVAQ